MILCVSRHLKLVANCASLGGLHTTVCVPARLSHICVPKEEREALGVTEALVRISAGLEDVKADIDQALKKAIRATNSPTARSL